MSIITNNSHRGKKLNDFRKLSQVRVKALSDLGLASLRLASFLGVILLSHASDEVLQQTRHNPNRRSERPCPSNALFPARLVRCVILVAVKCFALPPAPSQTTLPPLPARPCPQHQTQRANLPAGPARLQTCARHIVSALTRIMIRVSSA